MIIAIEYEQQQFSKFYNFSGGVMEKRKELTDSGKSRFRLRMPDTAALLLMIITVVAALTYIIPAGEFARVVDEETGRTLVQAGTYQSIASNPTTLKGYLSSVFRGILEASEIIAFIFVTGGAFGIVITTKDLDDFEDYTKIVVPTTSMFTQSMLVVPALQLLSYYVALKRGCDIDKPRNLAKSVTVE